MEIGLFFEIMGRAVLNLEPSYAVLSSTCMISYCNHFDIYLLCELF